MLSHVRVVGRRILQNLMVALVVVVNESDAMFQIQVLFRAGGWRWLGIAEGRGGVLRSRARWHTAGAVHTAVLVSVRRSGVIPIIAAAHKKGRKVNEQVLQSMRTYLRAMAPGRTGIRMSTQVINTNGQFGLFPVRLTLIHQPFPPCLD